MSEEEGRQRKRMRGASTERLQRARVARGEPTLAEKMLRDTLRLDRVEGVRFRRQAPYHQFILDFYAPSLNLIIELDGGYHDLQPEHDAERTAFLNACGLRVIRFQNEEVLTNLPAVLASLRSLIHQIRAQQNAPLHNATPTE